MYCVKQVVLLNQTLTGSPLGPSPPGTPLGPILPWENGGDIASLASPTKAFITATYGTHSVRPPFLKRMVKRRVWDLVLYSQCLPWVRWIPRVPSLLHHPESIRLKHTPVYSLMGAVIRFTAASHFNTPPPLVIPSWSALEAGWETHCLSNDACDTRLASEACQALEAENNMSAMTVSIYTQTPA